MPAFALSPSEHQAMTSLITTPESRQNYIMGITEISKKRVRDADPNGGRCLVENTIHAVDYCHCIPRKYMNEEKIVCVYRIHLFILGSNTYHSSIALNGPGT